MTKMTTVSKIEIARKKDGSAIQGKNRTGAWSLWNLWDADNVKYGVFESVLGKDIQAGDSVLINYETEPWGTPPKGGLNYKITDVTKVAKESVPTESKTPSQGQISPKNDALETLKRIEEGIRKILARIP